MFPGGIDKQNWAVMVLQNYTIQAALNIYKGTRNLMV